MTRSMRRTLTPASVRSRDSDRDIERTLRFITPMFGGGVKLGGKGFEHRKEPDLITPVRGSAVRGQLRMWWRRACSGGLAPAQILEREKLLWGWASTQAEPNRALVGVTIDASRLGAPAPVAVYDSDNPNRPAGGWGDALAYGAFPLQPSTGARDPRPGSLTQYPGTFKVRLTVDERRGQQARIDRAWAGSANPFESINQEVELALRLFGTFGGLGGRTRRGFGAVEFVGDPAIDPVVAAQDAGWHQSLVVGPSRNDALAALRAGLHALQQFRQGRGLGRNPGQQNRPGRSRWPEPDTIRRLSGRHAEMNKPEHPVNGVAPRAAFGMPIVTHFKDDRAGDPGDHEIRPTGERSRLASPLVLRPARQDGGRYAPIALRLPLQPGDRKVLDVVEVVPKGQRSGLPVAGRLTPEQAKQVRPLNGQPDVLAAFLQQFPALTKGS